MFFIMLYFVSLAALLATCIYIKVTRYDDVSEKEKLRVVVIFTVAGFLNILSALNLLIIIFKK